MDRELYVELPEGFNTEMGRDGKPKAALVSKCLFGFRQSNRLWEEMFADHLTKKLGFTRSVSDPCVYVKREGTELILLATWTDDLIIASSSRAFRDTFVANLSETFDLRDEGAADELLGVELSAVDGGFKLSMPKYVRSMLREAGMQDCNPCDTPSQKGLSLIRATPGSKVDGSGVGAMSFRCAVGKLLWAAVTCRPDLSHVVGLLCRHLERPTADCRAALKRVMQYCAATPELGICYSRNASCEHGDLSAFTDSDWGQCPSTGRSTSGLVILHAGGPVEWSSRLQTSVAMSSCEAECFAIASAVVELDYLRGLNAELGFELPGASVIAVDNQSAIYDAHNATGRRTRAINLRFHRVRQSIAQQSVRLRKVRGGNSCESEQVADMFTKGLNRPLFQALRSRIMG